ncbi:MAG: PIN domain-containing protein [Oscillospiraceae bacterium]
MKLVDANVILRYVLNDNEEMASQAEKAFNDGVVYIPMEVLAEVIYVLLKVYEIDRKSICETVLELLNMPNVQSPNKEVAEMGINCFHQNNIDFVDGLLVGYKQVANYDVMTFDKKLKKLL